MATDTALIEKREELKRRLAAGEYKTLVDIFLAGIDRMLRKIARRSRPLPAWLITVIVSLAVTVIFFAAIYIAGDITTLSVMSKKLGLADGQTVFYVILYLVFPPAAAILINYYITRLFVLWQGEVLDATQSVESLGEFENWLEKSCDRPLHLALAIAGGGLLVYSVFVAYFTHLLDAFVGYGYTLGTVIPCMFVASFIYQLFMVIMLSVRLRRYDLKLFASDPGSSKLIHRLSRELGYSVYIVAFFAAFFTLTSALTRQLTFGFALTILSVFGWLPLVALFVSNQTSLSSIIRQVKWKTLDDIQAKVERLQAAQNFEDKETMEAINRLMDYHDRVKATRNSAVDLETTLNFINSLLLPLITFILGNLELALQFLVETP